RAAVLGLVAGLGLVLARGNGLALFLAAACCGFLDRTHHVERGLGQRVVLAFEDLLERTHRVLALHELARRARERFGDEERLRQEALDAARARDGLLVLFAE